MPLFERQFAFLPRKSTTAQLLLYTEFLHSHVSKDQQMDAVYLDFARAFDSVSHEKLLYKLGFLGIAGELLKWIESVLNDRLQCVRVGSKRSNWFPS